MSSIMSSMQKASYERKLRDLRYYISPAMYARALTVSPRNRATALALLEKGRAMYMFGRAPESDFRLTRQQRHEARRQGWVRRSGERLAALAGYRRDEHGTWDRGDHLSVAVCDFVPARESAHAPLFDTGGEGLALVLVSRKRVYARSSDWRPSTADGLFLVGRNEAGTYFAHPVKMECGTVREAVEWMWQGFEVIARQGDIALVQGGRSGYIPALPAGHVVGVDGITHPTHPAIPLPGKGQRIVVALRARYFSHGTRD